MKYFEDKWVWVTGASKGIGLEMVKLLVAHDANIIISSRTESDLIDLKSNLKSRKEVVIIPLDLEKHDDLDGIMAENQDIINKVDILINNAGVSQRSLLRETKFEVYKRLININYLGIVKMSLNMLKIFEKKGGGHFATVSSVAGIFATPYRSGYGASKMALGGFFETLRAENKNPNIKITMLYPGFIHTNISIHAFAGDGNFAGEMDQAQANGMPADAAAKKMIDTIAKEKDHAFIGGFREVKMAPFLNRYFPRIFKFMIKRMKVR